MKENFSPFNMLLAQEITNLERFIIKSPLGTNEFWSEWQKKAGEIIVTKAAVKKALRLSKESLPEEEKLKLTTMLESYREIANYLELLRQTALKIKGIEGPNWDIFDGIEGENEGEDDISF